MVSHGSWTLVTVLSMALRLILSCMTHSRDLINAVQSNWTSICHKDLISRIEKKPIKFMILKISKDLLDQWSSIELFLAVLSDSQLFFVSTRLENGHFSFLLGRSSWSLFPKTIYNTPRKLKTGSCSKASMQRLIYLMTQSIKKSEQPNWLKLITWLLWANLRWRLVRLTLEIEIKKTLLGKCPLINSSPFWKPWNNQFLNRKWLLSIIPSREEKRLWTNSTKS